MLKGATKFPVDLADYNEYSWINIKFAEKLEFKFKRLVLIFCHQLFSLTLLERKK